MSQEKKLTEAEIGLLKNLQQEFEKLEESMDVLLGLKEDEKLKPKNNIT